MENMDHSDGYGSESTQNSSDLLWESVKVDLNFNRACQSDQLQSLKGTSVRLPVAKQNALKRKPRNKLSLKNHHKQRAFRRAVEIISVVARNLKRSKKSTSVKNSESFPCLKFQVSDNILPTPSNDVSPFPSDDVSPTKSANTSSIHSIDVRETKTDDKWTHFNHPSSKNQYVQTETKEFVDKFSETVFEENSNLHGCRFSNPQLSKQPSLTCGMFPSTINACCHSCFLSHCFIHRWQQPVDHIQSPSIPSVSTNYSLKEICEELLVQLSAKEASAPPKTSSVQNNEASLPTISTNVCHPTVPDFGKLVETIKSIHNDLKNQAPSTAHLGVNTDISVTLSQSCETAQSEVVPPRWCLPHEPSKLLLSPRMPNTTFSAVTPDLLLLASKVRETVQHSDAFALSKGEHTILHNTTPPPVSAFRKEPAGEAIQSKQMGCGVLAQREEEMRNAGLATVINASFESDNFSTQRKNIPKRMDDVKSSSNGKCTLSATSKISSVQHLKPTHNESKECAPTVDSNCADSAKTSTDSKTVASTSDETLTSIIEQSRDVTTGVVNRTDVKSDNNQIIIANKTLQESRNLVDCAAAGKGNGSANELGWEGGVKEGSLNVTGVEATSSAENSDRSPTPCMKETKNTDLKHSSDRGSKVLARIHGIGGIISTREGRNSPAFEEIDATEMENVLLIWRQQELLHQGQPVPEKSASGTGFLFKKLKRPRELPPELRYVRNFQPPPSNKVKSPSALQILDTVEQKTTTEEEVEDISEFSPPAIPTPKRQKLRLQKNPPSPLPVVFQKSKTPEENDFDLLVTSTPNDGKQTLPTSSSESRDPTPEEKLLNVGKNPCNNKCPKGSRISLRLKVAADSAKEKVSSTSDEKCLKEDFKNQIKERVNGLAKKWLHDKSDVEPGIGHLDAISHRSSPAPSVISECFQGLLLQDNVKKLSDIPVYEIGKAHDLAVDIILNPWRGINARRCTRDFVSPKYDTKSVVRLLWDLRSGANSDDVVKRIISFGWKEVHPIALEALVTLFVLSLDRNVPFVVEATAGVEEDDTSSIVSDVDQCSKKKTTSLRLIATKQIFKGECIEGLNGIFLKVSKRDKGKEKLKTWISPKFAKNRDWVVFGPLAYLKRKEGNCNTEAVILKNDVVAVKALRQILSGERLLVSFAHLEKSLVNKI